VGVSLGVIIVKVVFAESESYETYKMHVNCFQTARL
jgi:hypothetical protein